MSDLANALRCLVALFDNLQIPYAVMGGMAVRIYGIPRPTHDIDFTIAIDRGRLNELYDAVAGLGYTVAEEYRRGWVDQVAGMPLIKVRLYVENGGVDVDVFLAETQFQQQLLARRRRETIDGSPVWFVSPEDLILLKLVSYRTRDIADVGDVLFTQGQLDETYLRHWAHELGVSERLAHVLSQSPET